MCNFYVSVRFVNQIVESSLDLFPLGLHIVNRWRIPYSSDVPMC